MKHSAMPNLDLVPATQKDSPALLTMARDFHQEDGHSLSTAGEAALLAILAGEPMARVWMVHQAGLSIGYVVLTLGFSVEYGGSDGFIDDLYLIPSLRGQGLGQELLNLAMDKARQLGIRTLHLEVEEENTRAQRLYKRNGFEETGRRLMRRGLQR